MIKDFLKWWVTAPNGEEYMTFFHCSYEDLPMVIMTAFLSLFIVVIYFEIGRQSRIQSKNYPSSVSKKYLTAKVNVFILCALSGYGYTVLSIFINPYKLRIILLWVLIIWSMRFLRSMKSQSNIARILEGEKVLQKHILEIKSKELAIQKKFDSLDILNPASILLSEFYHLTPNKWYYVNDGIKYKLISINEDNLTFLTEMKDGFEFGLHYHDAYETCYVQEGTLDCPEKGIQVKQGESVYFKPFESHRPKAIGDTILTVIFKINNK